MHSPVLQLGQGTGGPASHLQPVLSVSSVSPGMEQSLSWEAPPLSYSSGNNSFFFGFAEVDLEFSSALLIPFFISVHHRAVGHILL